MFVLFFYISFIARVAGVIEVFLTAQATVYLYALLASDFPRFFHLLREKKRKKKEQWWWWWGGGVDFRKVLVTHSLVFPCLPPCFPRLELYFCLVGGL